MSPNVPKIGPRLYTNGLDGFAKNLKKLLIRWSFFSDFENIGPKR